MTSSTCCRTRFARRGEISITRRSGKCITAGHSRRRLWSFPPGHGAVGVENKGLSVYGRRKATVVRKQTRTRAIKWSWLRDECAPPAVESDGSLLKRTCIVLSERRASHDVRPIRTRWTCNGFQHLLSAVRIVINVFTYNMSDYGWQPMAFVFLEYYLF